MAEPDQNASIWCHPANRDVIRFIPDELSSKVQTVIAAENLHWRRLAREHSKNTP
jgi:hypothetical protein